MASSPARWHDPGWQGPLRARLGKLGMGALILAPSGTALFRAGHVGAGMQLSRQAAVLEGWRQLGTVELFVSVRNHPLAPASAALALVLALLFVGWQIGRGVVRPLEALSRAARQIAAHDLPHLFTPLYRGDTSRNRQSGGAGLGLTIARRILQAHSGDLLAANNPAGGAVFTGTLPAARPAPAPAPAHLATATDPLPGLAIPSSHHAAHRDAFL